MKYKCLLVLAMLLASMELYCQTKKQAFGVLENVETHKDVESVKKKYSNWTIRSAYTMGIDSVKHVEATSSEIGTVYAKDYDKGKVHVLYKVIGRRSETICKVKYIFFDGSKMAVSEIDSIRSVVLQKYEQGIDFTELVKEYNMDGNPTGDLNWFYRGTMVTEFEDATMPKAKGDIFTVNVDSRKWYYVVLKTHDNQITSVTETVSVQFVN